MQCLSFNNSSYTSDIYNNGTFLVVDADGSYYLTPFIPQSRCTDFAKRRLPGQTTSEG